MRERDWETLTLSLHRRNCILLLGPEVFDEASDSIPPLALTRQLARELAEDLDRPPEVLDDLPPVAQQYARANGRNTLEAKAVQFYKRHAKDRSEVHDKLAAIPFYLTITSCHDNLFQNALRVAKKLPVIGHYHFRGENPDYIEMGTVERPLIYQLYGSTDEPDSLVLSENDLLDFLVNVISKNPPLPGSIRSEIQKKANCFLFLGFGIRHWYLRILLHVLKFNQIESRSFALEAVAASASDMRQTIVFYRTGYRIEIFQCEIRKFVAEFYERCMAVDTDSQADLILPDMSISGTTVIGPKVFISHAREDREVAAKIFKAFQQSGAEPWVDVQQLEGGDDWNRVIRQRIEEADYFVVLNSEALRKKQFSYINREIKLALQRQQDARTGIRFITPVQIDDTALIEDVKPYQAVPGRSDTDLQALISSIKRDFARRSRL